MASASAVQTLLMTKSMEATGNRTCLTMTKILYPDRPMYFGSKLTFSNTDTKHWTKRKKNSPLTGVAAFGDVSSDGTNYLIAGAVAVALLGTAFPILFSRNDLCPESVGAGFVRKTGVTLRANAARKDQAEIVCPRCNGLGKLNQIDK